MKHFVSRHLRCLLADESGQDLPEYAVLVALVALAVLVAVVLLGEEIATTFNTIGSTVSGADVANS